MSIDRKIHWRCFHCNAAFTKAQERHARDHFGDDQDDRPVCLMRLPGEYHLLKVLRGYERELKRHRAEDTGLIRSIYSMQADHAVALRREEERGYEKGIADARAELSSRISFLEQGIREAQDSLRFNQDDVIWFGGASLETLWEHLESVRDPDGLDPGCPEDDRKAALSADTGSGEESRA